MQLLSRIARSFDTKNTEIKHSIKARVVCIKGVGLRIEVFHILSYLLHVGKNDLNLMKKSAFLYLLFLAAIDTNCTLCRAMVRDI